MIYIVDIDGTIADCSHRLHFIQQKPANWNSFFAACADDEPIPEVIETVKLLHEGGAEIVMITGRSDAICKQTHDWLTKWSVPCDALYMRKAGDHRQDNVVKAELFNKVCEEVALRPARLQTEIIGVFEDRKQVVDMYREKGLKVFQVAEGNF